MHDLLINGTTIVDGTGAAPYAADVAVSHGRISGAAQRCIDEETPWHHDRAARV